MNKKDILEVFYVLQTTYPKFYKDFTKEELNGMIDLWTELFKDCNKELVFMAVKELINTFKFPPTIADIKEKMYELEHKEDEKTPSELWESLNKAISNSAYNSQEEFNNLPEEVKIFIGTPRQLFELSQMPSETINSVTKGQFLKQIENIKVRKKTDEMMLPETKEKLQSLQNKFAKQLTEGEN